MGIDSPPRIRWEGAFWAHHSFAAINRALCRELAGLGFALDLAPCGEPEADPASLPEGPALLPLVGRGTPGAPAVVVRHRVPPDLSRPAGARLVIMQSWEFGPAPTAWARDIADSADELWVLSDFVRHGFVEAGVPPERVFTLPAGFDPALCHPAAEPLPLPTGKRFRFLFVGGSVHRKGLDVLVRAYLSAFTPADDVCLVIKDHAYYGNSVADQVARLQASRRAPEILYYYDHVWPQQMPAFYRAADCLVHPFRGEGFGMPVLEAMACGRPVIVTDTGPVREFCPAQAGWFVPARRVELPEDRVDHIETAGRPYLAEPDADALAHAMRQAWEDAATLAERGRVAAAHAHAQFTWPAVARRYAERLRRVAHGGAGAPAATPASVAPPSWTLAPTTAEAYRMLIEERLPDAVQAFVRILRETPEDVDALVGAAHCALALDEPAWARTLLGNVLRLEPGHPRARAALDVLGV